MITTTIHKSRNRAFYAKISNQLLQNDKLSFKARGLLAYILSLPDNWELHAKHLETASPQGREAVGSAMKELQKLGYLSLTLEKCPKSGKITGRRWIAYDDPADNTTIRVSRNTGFPSDGLPATTKETVVERKELEKGNMSLCSKPAASEPSLGPISIQSLESRYHDIDADMLQAAFDVAQTQLQTGKLVRNPEKYVVGLARKMERDRKRLTEPA